MKFLSQSYIWPILHLLNLAGEVPNGGQDLRHVLRASGGEK